MHTLNTTLILVKVTLLHLSVLEAPCGGMATVKIQLSLYERFIRSLYVSFHHACWLQLHNHRTHLDFSQQTKTLTVYSCATLINSTEKSSN